MYIVSRVFNRGSWPGVEILKSSSIMNCVFRATKRFVVNFGSGFLKKSQRIHFDEGD